jgi:hypothetical protein
VNQEMQRYFILPVFLLPLLFLLSMFGSQSLQSKKHVRLEGDNNANDGVLLELLEWTIL